MLTDVFTVPAEQIGWEIEMDSCCLQTTASAGFTQVLSPSVSRQQIYPFHYLLHSCCIWHHADVVVIVSVWRASIPVDGEPEVRRELQPPPGADGEACGVVCQLAEDWPADGFPQRVLRSSQTTGTKTNGGFMMLDYQKVQCVVSIDAPLFTACFEFWISAALFF